MQEPAQTRIQGKDNSRLLSQAFDQNPGPCGACVKKMLSWITKLAPTKVLIEGLRSGSVVTLN